MKFVRLFWIAILVTMLVGVAFGLVSPVGAVLVNMVILGLHLWTEDME